LRVFREFIFGLYRRVQVKRVGNKLNVIKRLSKFLGVLNGFLLSRTGFLLSPIREPRKEVLKAIKTSFMIG